MTDEATTMQAAAFYGSRSVDSGQLSWALGIATYQRLATLPVAIESALRQSRPPAQIVVVDASPRWDETRDAVLGRIGSMLSDVAFEYTSSDRASLPHQRNLVLARCDTDVVFLFDDDAYMHPGCAEAIMRVYEADPDARVVGVAASEVSSKPPWLQPDVKPRPQQEAWFSGHRRVSGLRRAIRRLRDRVLPPHDLFVPYDERFPEWELPDPVKRERVRCLGLMAGYCMTVRREAATATGFEARMQRYASGEDSDFSYRLSRLGALVRAYDAKLFHDRNPSGRMSPFTVAAFGAINPLFMHRLHSTDRRRSVRRSRQMLIRRTLLQATEDLKHKRWSLPAARGYLLGLRNAKRILTVSDADFDRLYAQMQQAVAGAEA